MNNVQKMIVFIVGFLFISDVHALNYPPKTIRGRIKVAAANSKCGSFVITPQEGIDLVLLDVEEHRKTEPTTLRAQDVVMLKNKSMVVPYDWAGNGPFDHYEIICKNLEGQEVHCSDVVDIESLQHNQSCRLTSGIKRYSLFHMNHRWIELVKTKQLRQKIGADLLWW